MFFNCYQGFLGQIQTLKAHNSCLRGIWKKPIEFIVQGKIFLDDKYLNMVEKIRWNLWLSGLKVGINPRFFARKEVLPIRKHISGLFVNILQ